MTKFTTIRRRVDIAVVAPMPQAVAMRSERPEDT